MSIDKYKLINTKMKHKIMSCTFIMICVVCVLIYAINYDKVFGYTNARGLVGYSLNLLRILLCIISLIFFDKSTSIEEEVYSSTNAKIPFILTYLSINIIGAFLCIQGAPTNAATSIFNFAIIALIFAIILISSYCSKVKLNNFNFNKITVKQLISVFFCFLVYFLPYLLFNGKNGALRYYTNHYNTHGIYGIYAYIIYILICFIQPAFFEELLYRGLLIAALKSYNIDKKIINMIQATLFGITHYNYYLAHQISFGYAILGTGLQILTGYILGEIYYKTKSLTPCIIFHVLLDVV